MNENPDHSAEDTQPMPRWVKVSGIIAIVLVVLFLLLLLFGGGRHGPGRHLASGGDAAAERAQG